MLSGQIVRNFSRSAVLRHGGPEGFPGANLPFSIENRYRLLALSVVFFSSAFVTPFLIVRHQMKK